MGPSDIAPIAYVRLVAAVVAVVLAFEGARRIRASGASRLAVGLVASGLVLCAFDGATSYWQYVIVCRVLEALQPSRLSTNPPDVPSNLSAEQREEWDRFMGRNVFRETGKLRTFADGRLHVPTQEEIASRERMLTERAQLAAVAGERFVDAILIWASGVLAVALGWLFSRRRNVAA